MKKFLNDPEDFVAESVAGLVSAYPKLLALNETPLYVRRKQSKRHGVAVVSGGGSGHEPLDTGFVGRGMLDAACPGRVFTAPSPDQIVAAARRVGKEQGVLLVVKNYPGDINSFQLARDMLDIPSEQVLVNDDVASAYAQHGGGRRGVAGTIVVQKIAGAAAQTGVPLLECKRLGDKSNQATATFGIALSSCQVPGAAATFDIGPAEMEVGVGLHGEPGQQRSLLTNADRVVSMMLEPVVQDLQLVAGQRVLLITNGLGGTPLGELHLLHHVACKQLAALGVEVKRALVGNYATSLETAGASITLTVLDDELLSWWDAPVHTPAMQW
jgi:dihydroxyacetone kinase-like protein